MGKSHRLHDCPRFGGLGAGAARSRPRGRSSLVGEAATPFVYRTAERGATLFMRAEHAQPWHSNQEADQRSRSSFVGTVSVQLSRLPQE